MFLKFDRCVPAAIPCRPSATRDSLHRPFASSSQYTISAPNPSSSPNLFSKASFISCPPIIFAAHIYFTIRFMALCSSFSLLPFIYYPPLSLLMFSQNPNFQRFFYSLSDKFFPSKGHFHSQFPWPQAPRKTRPFIFLASFRFFVFPIPPYFLIKLKGFSHLDPPFSSHSNRPSIRHASTVFWSFRSRKSHISFDGTKRIQLNGFPVWGKYKPSEAYRGAHPLGFFVDESRRTWRE